ncbi:QWRF motif-containing protein 7 [Lycium barbarum]|uniref:QWRF motif-containing protein 7 n=1 Tax=Lycium barbarum TaxID=112863 RepID=UPI00293F050C|nr:QWRF motif-containing protein 7 [Lycium barbarum]
MEKNRSRTIPRSPANSPRLLRSKSGMSLPEIHTVDPVPPKLVNRSKSTTKLRSYSRGEENISPLMIKNNKKFQENGDHNRSFAKFLQRDNGSSRSTTTTTCVSTNNSRSAWAMSPGRPLPNSTVPIVPKSPSSRKLKMDTSKDNGGGGRGGTVASVLKYFKQKKVSPVLEEDFHQYRLMNNRLVQWRFVNARAEASMAAIKRVAQKKLFNVWLRISIMRNFTAEKKIQVQKLKHDIKVSRIMNSQGNLLREWQRLEVKNSEAVGRVARKLSAVSLCLPLVDGAEAKVTAVYDAIITAEEIIDGIQEFIMNMQWQVEQSCYLLTQLIVILKQEEEFLEELETHIKTIDSLEVEEQTLRVHCIQLAKEMTIRWEGA